MPDNQAKIELTATDTKLNAVLNRGENRIRQYGNKALAVFSRVNQSIMSNYSKLGALEKIGIGFGVFEMAKDMLEFDGVLRKIGRTSGSTGAEMAGLRQQIIGLISPGSGIPLSKNQFVEMAEAMNAAGVSMQTIKTILPEVGKGAVASHTDVKIYAETIGELMEKYKVAASDLPALQDQLNEAMKMEDVRKNPEAFLQSLTGMAKTMQLLKTQGLGNLTPLMALQAQLTQFTGSAGEASGSTEALFTGLWRLSNKKAVNRQLMAHGIEFFNKGGGVKSIVDLIPQFRKLAIEAQKSGKSLEEVSMAIFGRPEAAKTLMMITQRYNETLETQGKLLQSTGSKARDYATESESLEKKLQLFQNQLDTFKVNHMTGMLSGLSRVLDVLQAHPIITKGLLSAVGLAGIVVGVNKVTAAFKELGITIGAIGNTGAFKVVASVLGGVGSILALEGGAAVAMQQAGSAEAAGLRKWRTEHAGDYARQQQVLGGRPMQPHTTINMTVHVTPNQIRTDTDELNAKINVKRGDFLGYN